MKKSVSPLGLERELAFLLEELAPEAGLSVSSDGVPVYAKRGDALSVSLTDGAISVTYPSLCAFSRAVSHISSVLSGKDAVSERKRYDMLCFMADVSHSAALRPVRTHSCVRQPHPSPIPKPSLRAIHANSAQ